MTTGEAGSVRAVLLAAGQGKRMKSARPKVLHDVLGISILGRILRQLDRLALEKIHIVVGHEAEQVVRHVEQYPPNTAWSAHLQEPQLGTGDALRKVVPALDGFKGTLLVSVSDTPLLTSDTLDAFIRRHREKKSVMSLLTTVVDDAKNYGRIVRGAQGRIEKIVEHRDATAAELAIREVNSAIYCLEWPDVNEALKRLSNDNEQKEYYLTDLVQWCVAAGKPLADMVVEDWREVLGINSRLELAEAIRLLSDRTVTRLALEEGVTVVDPASTWIAPEVRIGQDSVILPGCHLMGEVEIGPDCVIGPSTVLLGPVRIGPRSHVVQSLLTDAQVDEDCRVGPFAHLRAGARVSAKCRVGNFVEIKNSDVGCRTNVSHLSYIGDATLGDRVNIGAGTITANYDHLTGLKQRTIVKDGSSTGSNSVLVAPVVVGNEAVVAALTAVTRDVPDGALAVGRARQENKAGWVDKKKQHEVAR